MISNGGALRRRAGRAPFRFSPSVLPAPPPSAAAATGISGHAALPPPSSYPLTLLPPTASSRRSLEHLRAILARCAPLLPPPVLHLLLCSIA